KKSGKLKRMIKSSLLTFINPHNSIAAQFRAIRNNIEYTANGVKLRSLIVTSPNAGEGKTTTAMNLALSKAQRGDKVLVIDANIKNPSVHHIFNTKLIPGLTNVLAAQISLVEAIVPTE